MNPEGTPAATIHAEMAAKLNFACHQSAFAFIRELRIENNDLEERLEDVLVRLSSNPAFLKPKSWPLDRIAPGGILAISDRDIELDGTFLLDLADSMSGFARITVEHGGVVIADETNPVELLTYNEWGGAGYMPELLAAFSVPNDPAVDRILRDTSLILRNAGKPDGIDGYKSRSRQRVWEISSAIYAAICNLGITYTLPPASFERDGQKIRLPGQILESRVATCLDTTLLFCSVLEQAGLNPIVALPQEHAVVGVWLQPEDLSNIVIDEAEILRKRSQLNELLLIETTYVTSHPAHPFSKAVEAASDVVSPDRDDTFDSAIDIRRARAHRISPLGKKSVQPQQASDSAGGARVEITLEEAPLLPDFDDGLEEEDLPESPAGRLERWQRKLLDLSARNPLLNHRSPKTSLQLICPEPGLLEDLLAEGTRISIQSVPQPTSKVQDEELHRHRTGEIITQEYAREALQKKQVLVDLAPAEMSRRAVAIYRMAQTALQEGGANTLYLALGFLLWKRDEKDTRQFRAPLVLLPVTLIRQSVRSDVRMLAHDDEPRFNTTLLEMLRKDFQVDIRGLDGALPTDSSGIDVDGIWHDVRKSVKDVPGFEVTEDVVLGHFSFAKFLMWKDLVDRSEALRSNAIVRHLIDTPRVPFPSTIAFVDGADIDRHYKPSDLLAPLPADSSQMAAIATADRGKDFVIIGPPGTGKSQTISNLIAHMLGKEKTVLFVSEKTAALEVVYRRLKDIGLGQFCLELHSNKARKLDVLSQLGSAWEYQHSADGQTWAVEAERLKRLRDQLNLVVDRLHVCRRNGMTAFEAMGIQIRDEDFASRVTFSWPSADHHDRVQLDSLREAVTKLRIHASEVDDIAHSPFRLVVTGDWSPEWQGEVAQGAGKLSTAVHSLEQECDTLLDTIGVRVPDRSMARIDALSDLALVLQESWKKHTAFALEIDGAERIEALQEAAARLEAYAEAQRTLSCTYEPMAWRDLDGEEIARRWRDANGSWLIKRLFARWRVLQDMREGGALGVPDPDRDARTLSQLRQHGAAIDRLDEYLAGFKDWKGYSTPSDAMLALSALGHRARNAVGRLADDPSALLELRGRVKTLLLDGNDLLAPEAAVGRTAQGFLAASHRFKGLCDAFETVAGQSVREHFAENFMALEAIRDTCDTIACRSRELRGWCNWWRRRTEAMDLQLEPLVSAIENGYVPIDEIEATFEAAYCSWWSGAVISEDEVLRNFSTPEHVATIEEFREIDDRFQNLTAAYIGAKLAGRLPNSENVTRNSSWGILRHEIQKRRRHKPVRQLMSDVPDIVTTLAPCLMMSPLSVAQYLAPNQDLFDVVVFDEASQITVWDAVGCLARGQQAIVVGDPKQMPPTNFFARADDDPDGDIDMEGDLESILEEMLGASIPECTLSLHYRSRKESLIAFSNSRYYDNQLVTFPAPAYPDDGIQLIRHDGFYARGQARHNQGEAKAIVAEILRRLIHQDDLVRRQSIGVVTFNTEQQTLVENLLDEARSQNPSIEAAFAPESRNEPVFVKNLETVQGDERDVIMFSITYGPDQAGHMTMNFGPLNRDGGERRLNVAISRARSEMLVFSTLSPERIDLSRTQARAVADLKHFLEYAERGPAALGAATHGSMGDFDSPFEVAVARALRKKGWDVHPQVGVSAYRIDLGIVHPDAPGVYLAGVECDGAMYHSSAFARERDKIRQAVLEGLGWTLFRVWSTDWWTHQAKAISALHESLELRLKTDRQEREVAARVTGEEEAPSRMRLALDADEVGNLESLADEMSQTPSIDGVARQQVTFAQRPLPSTPPSTTPSTDTSAFEFEPVGDRQTQYTITQLDQTRLSAEPAQFHLDEYSNRLSAMIDHVIDTEGPIHQDVLVRRIARHHGFRRAGRQIRERVIEIAKRRHRRSKENVGLFFWRKGTIKDRLAPARYVGRDGEVKKIEYICKEELRAIRESLSIEDDLIEMARHMGIARLSQGARQRLLEALDG